MTSPSLTSGGGLEQPVVTVSQRHTSTVMHLSIGGIQIKLGGCCGAFMPTYMRQPDNRRDTYDCSNGCNAQRRIHKSDDDLLLGNNTNVVNPGKRVPDDTHDGLSTSADQVTEHQERNALFETAPAKQGNNCHEYGRPKV